MTFSPKKIALAYSGGLDTSIIVPWLKERFPGVKVVCVAADIGQGDELSGVKAKAIASGADECYVEDLRDEYVRDFIFPTLRAGAIYGRKYLLGTSMGRPLIARRQVEVARAVGADALAHERAVKTGIRSGDDVQILSGVSAGERVITQGGLGLDDKAKIQIGQGEK